jgi:hypothetical protein
LIYCSQIIKEKLMQKVGNTYSPVHYKRSIEEDVDFDLWDKYYDDPESPLYTSSPHKTVQEWEDSTND